jgi:murein DD-endopeptidase MepM/ murein hydrolase activator NlpD
VLLIVVLLIVLVAAAAMFVWLINAGAGAAQNDASTAAEAADLSIGGGNEPTLTPTQVAEQQAIAAGASATDPNLDYLPTPLIAHYEDVDLHSPIAADCITEIEFHQASYKDAFQLTPYLTIEDAEQVMNNHGTTRPPANQEPTGNTPFIGSAVSTWRTTAVGPQNSAMDVGAKAGDAVYAPVTGVVVNVRPYKLYNEIDDYEIHIQIPQYPNLDIVMLHVDNLQVKAGDKVVAGVTQVATVRDIGSQIDNDLSNFTAVGDPGNHCHVQVNNVNYPGYTGLDGAVSISEYDD